MSTEPSRFGVDPGHRTPPSPPTRLPRRPLPWRSSLVTIVLAGLAAFAGARLGSHQAPTPTQPLSERIFGLLGDEVVLSPQQRQTILAIAERYAPERDQLRLHSRMRNADLLRSMVHEQRFGPETEQALEQLQVVMGQRLKQSLEYMQQVRGVLTPAQRAVFDRRLIEEAAATR
jgi:Spy/CpxP family protein refolding chaperone